MSPSLPHPLLHRLVQVSREEIAAMLFNLFVVSVFWSFMADLFRNERTTQQERSQSWGQFFLKYILSHPAVTCV